MVYYAKEYIDILIAYVCGRVTKTVIIGGPKDIGKSKGISSVHRSALKVGFTVFEMNLKGTIEEADSTAVSYHQTILEIAISIHCRIDTLLDPSYYEYSKFFDSFCCCCYMVITSSCYKGLVVEAFKVAIITSCFDCSSKYCAIAMVFHSNEIFSVSYSDKSK